jgi:hypothetical protein
MLFVYLAQSKSQVATPAGWLTMLMFPCVLKPRPRQIAGRVSIAVLT